MALPSKEAFLYVFDRVTGKPVWPIEERPVPQSDVPGEKTSPTQPFPTKPPAYARNFIKVPDDLIDFTPEMRAQADRPDEALSRGGHVHSAGRRRSQQACWGRMNLGNASGGTNWPGAGYDPETHIVYAQAAQSAVTSDLAAHAAGRILGHPLRLGPQRSAVPRSEGPGFGSAADAPQRAVARRVPAAAPRAARARQQPPAVAGGGLGPLQRPGPADRQAALRRDLGDQSGSRRHSMAGALRRDAGQRPQQSGAQGDQHPQHRQSGSVGLLVTKTLVDPRRQPGHYASPHPRGAMLRAYDKATGKEVGAVWMPAPQSGSPMTYEWHGKQYIVVAVSGGAVLGRVHRVQTA